MCGGVTVHASDAWWQVTHRRPFVPISWKKGLFSSIDPAGEKVFTKPVGSRNGSRLGMLFGEDWPIDARALTKPKAIAPIAIAMRAKYLPRAV
jgi:hypothetical protein